MDNLNNTDLIGGTIIPRTSSAKAGSAGGTETEAGIEAMRTALNREKERLEIERERTLLEYGLGKQKAEAERDMLRAALERERMQASDTLEQAKLQAELFARLLPRPAERAPEIRPDSGANAGYVSQLVGYHALKRVSADITRGVGAVLGSGNDVRILIVDSQDYAPGDIPFIEVTSQLSVFDVRCRKQVAANKELADLAMGEEVQEAKEETGPVVKSGITRLSPLSTSPVFLSGNPVSATAAPAATGIAGTAGALTSTSGSESSEGHRGSVRTEGLIAAVAASLRAEKRNTYVYNFYSMDTTGPQSRLMNMYAAVLDCSSRLAQSRNRLQYFIGKKTELLAELRVSLKKNRGMPAAEKSPEIAGLEEEINRESAWLDRAYTEILATDAIHAELGIFIRNITTTDPAQPGSKLAQAIFREKIHELGITHLLYLNVLSSGGETLTRKWLLGTGTVSYLGGAVAGYVLSRVEGEVLASDILPVLYSFGFDPADQRNSPLKQIRFEKQEQKK